MKVYISLPISGRPEPTFDTRYAAAQRRCALIISLLRKCDEFRDAEFVHTFDLNPLGTVTEAQAMGRCVQAVIECDAIFEDYNGWTSRGCTVEAETALQYRKRFYSAAEFCLPRE